MVLLYYEHISNVCLSEHNAMKKYRKNLPKTLPKRGPNPLKIDAKNVLFFNIDFFGFRPRFWRVLGLQDGAKSAAQLAAPGVLKPTAFYAFGYPAWTSLGEAPESQDPPKSRPKFFKLGPCWHIFRSGVPFFRSWALLMPFLGTFGASWPLL